MRKFREAYRRAVDELPEYHMDAGQVRDELHHQRMVAARRRKAFLSAAAASCVFLICGVGTATAMNYYSSTIKVRDNGFSFQGRDAVIFSQDSDFAAGDEGSPRMEDGQPSVARAGGEVPVEQGVGGQQYSDAGSAGEQQYSDAGSAGEDQTLGDQSVVIESVVLEETLYSSIEEFRSSEDIAIAIPQLSWLADPEEIECQDVRVVGDPPKVMVSIRTADTSFYMSQDDNRDNQNYASSWAFPGEAVNERVITNDQGLSFTVFDSREDGEITATYAAISINGRDLTFDFNGYDEEVITRVLKELDLSVYVTEE